MTSLDRLRWDDPGTLASPTNPRAALAPPDNYVQLYAPADLVSHQWIGSPRAGSGLRLELTGPQEQAQTLRIEPRITSNNQLTLQQLCTAGLGIGLMVRADIDDDLHAARLVELLPDWHLPPIDVWAVTPQRNRQPAKVRHAIEALQTHLRAVPGARR